MKITNILVHGNQNNILDVSSADDYGSSSEENAGKENIHLTPVQVNSSIH